MELLFKEILLKDKSKKYECLDNFCEFYGWSVYEYGNKYILHDNQTGEMEYFGWFSELLHRLSTRALDYEINEHEFEDYYTTKAFYDYLTNLLLVYISNTDLQLNESDKRWLDYIIKEINKIEIESEKK